MDKTENRFYREPAFPEMNPNRLNPNPGMTLRDYFAAKAVQGMVANPEMTGDRKVDIVREAYEFADEMLRAREN
jgi:hypothetical protein